MRLRYTILLSIAIVLGYLLKTNLSCLNYNGNFHYSPNLVSFHLNELTTGDHQVPIFVVRFFHNKISVLMFDIFSRYIQFFNVFYLINIVGLAGLFGLLYFYFSFFSRKVKNKFIKIFGVLILLFPFLEIFQLIKLSFFFRTLYLILPYQAAAFMGFFFFLKQRKPASYIICFFLLLLTIAWIIVLRRESLNFCTTI